MKRLLYLTVAIIIATNTLAQTKGYKIFISVDMEGISGVVNWEDVRRDGKDYNLFRAIMTEETNAAIEGALKAGADEIWVRDSHGSARNILPDRLNKKAKLLRDWSGDPQAMMDGLDHTFDAVIFIGYHAMAGTPNATLDHTNSSSKLQDASINGISLPEAGFNALIAGYHDVPVVFVAGDQAICDQVNEIFDRIDTFATKEGMGNAALCLHPEVSFYQIKKGVEQALNQLDEFSPYQMKAPYVLKVKFLSELLANDAAQYEGVKRIDPWTVSYTGTDLMEVIRVFRWLY